MSLVIRHKGTGFYLQSHHRWTNQVESALRFNSGLRLVNYVERGGMRENQEQIEILIVPPGSTAGRDARL